MNSAENIMYPFLSLEQVMCLSRKEKNIISVRHISMCRLCAPGFSIPRFRDRFLCRRDAPRAAGGTAAMGAAGVGNVKCNSGDIV